MSPIWSFAGAIVWTGELRVFNFRAFQVRNGVFVLWGLAWADVAYDVGRFRGRGRREFDVPRGMESVLICPGLTSAWWPFEVILSGSTPRPYFGVDVCCWYVGRDRFANLAKYAYVSLRKALLRLCRFQLRFCWWGRCEVLSDTDVAFS